jgi:hypothetical protein
MAANQVGKTHGAGMETAFHLTGIYPEWWQGRRFATPVKSWVGGPDNEHVRDNACRILLGEAENRGTGTVPAWAILSIESGRGIAKSVDYFTVSNPTNRKRTPGRARHSILSGSTRSRPTKSTPRG